MNSDEMIFGEESDRYRAAVFEAQGEERVIVNGDGPTRTGRAYVTIPRDEAVSMAHAILRRWGGQ